MKIYHCINAVQKELSATGITKDRKNQQQGYQFRGIDDVFNALSPLLAAHGLLVLPRMLSRQCEERATKSGGTLFYTTVEAEFDFVAVEDGSKHVVKTYGEAMDSADKSTNKAMSAAYKYAAFLAFAIPTEGDNDADAHTHDVAPRKAAAKPAAKSVAKPEPELDLSPKARALRIVSGVAGGDAVNAAAAMAGWDDDLRDSVWALLDGKTQEKLTAVWPATG